MVLNQMTIDIHIWRDRWWSLAGSVAKGTDLGLAVRLLPLFGSRTVLLLSSVFVSLPRGIALLAILEHLVLMS